LNDIFPSGFPTTALFACMFSPSQMHEPVFLRDCTILIILGEEYTFCVSRIC